MGRSPGEAFQSNHARTSSTQREESMTTINAIRLASLVTGINVLVASAFSVVGVIRPQYLLPAGSVTTQASLILAMYAAARTIPLALFALAAIYKQATSALLILGGLAGAMQLLDAGIGLFERDLGKCAGPLFIAVLQFFAVSASQIGADHTSNQELINADPSLRPGGEASGQIPVLIQQQAQCRKATPETRLPKESECHDANCDCIFKQSSRQIASKCPR
jgi:hypothetical protein